MWHFKWTEIRLKQIESQELKYNILLEECDMVKHTTPYHFNLEDSYVLVTSK